MDNYKIIDENGIERDMTPEEILANQEPVHEVISEPSITLQSTISVAVPGSNGFKIIINGVERFMTQEEENEFLSRQQLILQEQESNSIRIPHAVTNFQARAILMQTPGSTVERTLFDDVNDWAQAQGGAVWQAWEYSNNLTRNGDLVQQAMINFNLTNEQVDALFLAASQIEA